MLTRSAFQEKENKWMPWLLPLVFMFSTQPKLLAKVPVINILFIIGACVSFAYMLSTLILSRERPSVAPLLLVAFQASFGLQTFISGGDIMMWGYISLAATTLGMAIDHFSKRDATTVLRSLVWLFTVYLTIHFIIGLFFKNGVVNDLGFIGIRTRLTDIIFPSLTLSLLLDHRLHRAWSHRTIYLFILCIYLIIYHDIMAALLGIVAMGAIWLFMVLLRRPWVRRICNVWTMLIAGAVANVLIVFVQITLRMPWFFENVLGRHGSLSYRTDIWSSSFPVIRENLFFGHGMADNGNFVPRPDFDGGYSYWQAHNQWLQIMHDGGIFSLMLFVTFLLVCYLLLTKRADAYVSACHLAALFAFVVMMTVEIFTYTPYFFVLPLTAACTCCNDARFSERKPWTLPWFRKKAQATTPEDLTSDTDVDAQES